MVLAAAVFGNLSGWHIRFRTLHRDREVRRLHSELQIALGVDSLTQVGNRRALDVLLAANTNSRRASDAGVVAILDLDHFKTINDTFGHQMGDKILAQMAEIIQKSVRNDDRVFRYGGEEFFVMLPGASLDAAEKIFERIRLGVRRCQIDNPATQSGFLTVSSGLATYLTGACLQPHDCLNNILTRSTLSLYSSHVGSYR